MKKNMGGIDRVLRLVVGVLLIYYGLVDTAVVENHVVRYLMAGFGVINIGTALVAFCPMYLLANLSTAAKTDS